MSVLSSFEFEVITLDERGQENSRQKRSAQYLEEDLGQGTKLEMVAVAGGTFLMGAPQTEEEWHFSQSPQRLVSIPSLFVGKYPITQAQWQVVAALPKVKQSLDLNPANFQGRNRPVENVSWYDALEFCDRLQQKTGYLYRLPSEAEWEYFCRAKTTTPFHFGETITTKFANYSGVDWEYMGNICSKGSYGAGSPGSDRKETTFVTTFKVANAFGIYDLHGNVKEWCADYWHKNYEGAPTNATAWISPDNNGKRVLRGGSWNVGPGKCRSAYRTKFDPAASFYDIGFRVVCSI
jgi:formylglycine-generating enzyme required for sulfatase activity